MSVRSGIPLNTLRAFESAARHGSFVQAGEELNVTPAAISHRVKDLEMALGRPMFRRKPRGIELTEAGRRFRDSVAEALGVIERAAAAVDRPPVAGPLTVSMPESFAEFWLLPRLPRLAAAVPGLDLTIEADSRLAALRGGAADLAVRFGQGEYPEYDTELLCGDAVTALAPPALAGSDATPRSTIERNALLEDYRTGKGEPWMGWRPWLVEAGIAADAPPRVTRLSNSALAIRAAVSDAGLCIGRLSLVLDLVRSRQLLPLFPWRSTEMAYFLVTPPIARENPRVLAFRDWLVDEVARHVADASAATGFGLIRPEDRRSLGKTRSLPRPFQRS